MIEIYERSVQRLVAPCKEQVSMTLSPKNRTTKSLVGPIICLPQISYIYCYYLYHIAWRHNYLHTIMHLKLQKYNTPKYRTNRQFLLFIFKSHHTKFQNITHQSIVLFKTFILSNELYVKKWCIFKSVKDKEKKRESVREPVFLCHEHIFRDVINNFDLKLGKTENMVLLRVGSDELLGRTHA